jgi:hypothetical protein
MRDGTQRQGGVRVAVIDERGEIGGCREGAATMDIGLRTDILDGCPKPQGLLWAVRSLAPRAVITDEIGTAEDAEALLEARNAGVAVVASVHAAAVGRSFAGRRSRADPGGAVRPVRPLGPDRPAPSGKSSEGSVPPMLLKCWGSGCCSRGVNCGASSWRQHRRGRPSWPARGRWCRYALRHGLAALYARGMA